MFHNLFSSFTHIFINIDIYSGSGGKESAEIQETQVWSLGLKDPLEEGMATPCSILACRIPRTEESGGPQSIGSQRVEHDWETKIVSLFTRTHVAFISYIFYDTYWWFVCKLLGLPGCLSGKEFACSAGITGDVGSIPRLGRSPGEGNGNPLQYSCLENPGKMMMNGLRSLAGYSPWRLQKFGHDWNDWAYTHTSSERTKCMW